LQLAPIGAIWAQAMAGKRRPTRDEERLRGLVTQASELGADVRFEDLRGTSRRAGGLCRVRGRFVIIVDRRLPAKERAAVLEGQLERLHRRLAGAHEPASAALASRAAAAGPPPG